MHKNMLEGISRVLQSEFSAKKFSVESFKESNKQTHESLHDLATKIAIEAGFGPDADVRSIAGATNKKVSQERHNAAVTAIMQTIKTYRLGTFSPAEDEVKNVSSEQFDSIAKNPALNFNASIEFFDPQTNDKPLVTTLAYTLMSLNKDATTSAIFPERYLDGNTSHEKVEVAMPILLSQGVRNGSGELVERVETPISQLYTDTASFNNNSTVMYPLVRDPVAYPQNSNNLLVEDVKQPVTVLTSGQSEIVEKAPIKLGVSLDILNLSQTPNAMNLGKSDLTDAIDRNAGIKSIVLKNADNEYIEIPMPLSRNKFTFNSGSTTNEKNLAFNASDIRITIKGNTLAFNTGTKTYTADLANKVLLDNVYAVFTVKMNGELDLTRGEISINGSFKASGTNKYTKVSNIADGADAVVSTALQTYLNSFEIVGYNPDLKRTNSNARDLGVMIEIKVPSTVHTVGNKQPVNVKDSIFRADEIARQQKLQSISMLETTQIRKARFEFLENFKELLKQNSGYVDSSYYTDSMPIASQVSKQFKPAYEELQLDVIQKLNSVQSSNKEADVASLIYDNIRTMVAKLYLDSRYSAAALQLVGDSSVKPHVLIVTDPYIERFLTVNGDTRLLGASYKHTVIADQDVRMRNKFYIIFTTESAVSGVMNEFDKLAFGATLKLPSVFGEATVTQNGAIVAITVAQPRFELLVNIPVLGYGEVTGLYEVFNSKTAIENHPV